ncbi:MAG: hypothetical protein QXV12_02300 [Candidatus Rehaiarchaeum fermentans]|nr:hypothetical protein [Candidatus Rehaiarchaeum fermentans]
MWFSSLTMPNKTLNSFIQTTVPVIHNYPLVLALKGLISEESYITEYNKIKTSKPPAERFNELGVYAYPLLLEKLYYKSVLLSAGETDYILYKPRTRAAFPLITRYNAIAPGTRGWTIIISKNELPPELYLRIGSKRFGIWKAKLEKITKFSIESGNIRIASPFNVSDTKKTLKNAQSLVLTHYAGDIAISGNVDRAIKFVYKSEEIKKPIPSFLEG